MRNFEVIGEASENVCNDPSEFAYLQPQIQYPHRVFSCPVPDADAAVVSAEGG